MHWILRYNHVNLNEADKVRLQTLSEYAPKLHQAYALRKELPAIFNMDLSLLQSHFRFQKWLTKVEKQTISCFPKFLKTLRNHFDMIANYFHKRATSGFVEGLNNELKTITRRSLGLKRTDSLFRRLWLGLNGYKHFLA